jgi:hypothetical protein
MKKIRLKLQRYWCWFVSELTENLLFKLSIQYLTPQWQPQ